MPPAAIHEDAVTRPWWSNERRNTLLIYLALIPAVLTMLYPLGWMVRLSVSGVRTGFFANYVDVWQSGPFDRYLFNSFVVAGVVVAGNALCASMVGYGLARRRFRGRRLLLGIILSTLMLPRQVTMIPLYLLMAQARLIDTYAALTLPFLVDAFNVFLMRQAFLGVPLEMEEAARVDGASDPRIFFGIALPLVKPTLAVLAINTFLTNWNSFLYPLVLTNSEQMRTLPVGLALYSQGEHSVDWGHLMAGSVLAALPVIVVFLLFQRQIVSGIMAGAGK